MATSDAIQPADTTRDTGQVDYIENHPVEILLFNSTGWITWVWLVIRVVLGWQWVQAGWEKLNNPKWMDGTSITGYWQAAINSYGQPHSQVAYDWYVNFLQWCVDNAAGKWMAPLVAYGEFLGGIALILGFLTGIAAFLLAFLNFNYMLAGSAGVNPVYFLGALLLTLAWKNAGWWGLDRWVLPLLGTPWHKGTLFKKSDTGTTTPSDVSPPASS
jgi:thiosulfate dehydrogenase [quinone] large subunit